MKSVHSTNTFKIVGYAIIFLCFHFITLAQSGQIQLSEKAKTDLAVANKRVEEELSKSRNESAIRLADAERRAQTLLEEAKARATQEASKIIATAQQEAGQQLAKAREALREDVANLAVKGAEQILRREVNASVHSELLGRLKTEL